MDHIQIYLKKKTPKPNRKREAGVWAGAEMPAEDGLAHNKRPFFLLRQCPLVSQGGISAEGQPVWLPKETGLLSSERSLVRRKPPWEAGGTPVCVPLLFIPHCVGVGPRWERWTRKSPRVGGLKKCVTLSFVLCTVVQLGHRASSEHLGFLAMKFKVGKGGAAEPSPCKLGAGFRPGSLESTR